MSTTPTTMLPPAPPAPTAPAPIDVSPPSQAPPQQKGWFRLPSRMLSGALARRRSLDSVIVGCLLTLLVISFDSAGWLTPVEFALYDARARVFQFFLPEPTDKLVHLDLDDGALRAVAASEGASWPWPRNVLAEMMDEVALAGPKVVGLDILFPEPQEVTWKPVLAAGGGGSDASTRPIEGDIYVGPSRRIDNDELFGKSLKRLGCALVPMALPFERRPEITDLQRALRAELARDVNQPQERLVERLRAHGFTGADLPEQVAREYLAAWRSEMSALIRREVRAAPVARELVKQRLLKLERSDLVVEGAFDELYNEALSVSHMVRFSLAIPPGFPALFSAQLTLLPVPEIAAAARYSANITFPFLPDGRVRAVPMFVKNDDRMYPQMGLAMACAQLGVDMTQLRYRPGVVIIPTPDGREIEVPHRGYKSTEVGEEIATFIDIPWWGGDKWAYMYDHPAHRAPVNHLSVVALWDLVLTKRKIAVNAKSADAALITVLDIVDRAAAEAYAAKPPPVDDINARRLIYEKNLPGAKENADFVKSVEEKDLDEVSRRFLASYETLPKLMSEFGALEQRLREARADMRTRLNGKAVFIGWTATGSKADFVPTSVHASCPGVVLHGAIFNGIMTGELWRTLPEWVTLAVTGFLGVFMTAAAAFMTPARALLVAGCLMIGYVLVNGLLMFDYGNLVLGAAGPLLCIAGVWQGCTLIRLIVERYQRNRIEGRFRSYVDPALVDYVVQNPEQAKLEGQVREMTVCFTDLGNFTPLTARLKEATVPLLNRIFGAMVPEIRRHNGYVNKFLGDGIMFFFGAPRQNPHHARDAMRALLEIQLAMRTINAELVERGLEEIELRAGVNTGNMVVGDAGSEKASDYTVLGDDVNLASRMESANKQLGTRMLVSQRTVDLAGDDGVLMRPVGQICVVGRDEPVVAYELMCREADATDEQRRLADMTRRMVDAFREARLTDCLGVAGELEREFGPSKLTGLYRDRCDFFLRQPSVPDFNCTITLSEK